MREDWVECTFGEIIYFKNGFAFKSSDYINDGIPIIRIGDIKQNQISLEDSKKVKESNDLDEYLIRKGDILIAMSGATTGKFGMYNLESKAYLNQRVGNIFPISQDLIYKPFLFYLLHFLKRQIEKDAYGGAQPNISSKKIEEMKVPFIPLPEQRAIVKKIEALFSSLDAGIADLKKAQDQLKIYRQAVLKKAFEGELTNTKGINYVELNELVDSVEYGSSAKSKEIGDIPVLRMGNIQKGLFDYSDLVYTSDISEIERYKLQKYDVLFNRTNSPELVGKTAIYKGECDAIFAGYLIRINYKKDLLNPFYLNYYLNSHEAKVYGNSVKSDGVNQSNINGTKLKGYPIPYTTLEHQAQIVKEIEARLSVCDAVAQQIKDSLNQAEALRQSILKKAFEGRLLSEAEIQACQQEPDYEPASMLLEKIKAEKEANKPVKKTKKKVTV